MCLENTTAFITLITIIILLMIVIAKMDRNWHHKDKMKADTYDELIDRIDTAKNLDEVKSFIYDTKCI